VARLLQSKSFLHLPFGRRRRKRPAHHRERSASRTHRAARSGTVPELLRDVRRNARRRLSSARRFRASTTQVLRSARRFRGNAWRARNSAKTRRLLHGPCGGRW
jgi:hypothetical protein